MTDCLFCKIIAGEIPSRTVYEDDLIKVIMNINPNTNGHLLILPKKHYTNIMDIDEKIVTHSLEITRNTLYNLLKERLNCEGLTIAENNLSPTNADTFLAFREKYNKTKDIRDLFILVCYSFNYQMRFNNKHQYNSSFGKEASTMNYSIRNNLNRFVEKLHSGDYTFCNKKFDEFDFSDFDSNDFVYCDPPYYNSTATYNEQNGWNEKDEIDLLNILDSLNEKGVKFALSNNLKYENPILYSWKNKYNLHILNINYNNCNYHKNNKQKDKEILITNY